MKHLCVCILFFQSFTISVSAQKVYDDEPIHFELIPPDFNPKVHVLLVMHLPNRQHPEKTSKHATNSLRKVFDKNYLPYKYIIVTPQELSDSTKYGDMSIYRFVLGNSVTTFGRVDGGYTLNLNTGIRTPNLPKQVAYTVISFRFYDRVKHRFYSYTTATSFVGNTLKPVFERLREK